MSEPFLGQIEAFPFGFVPNGWAACDGSLLAINSHTALFSLLGTSYGGNGTTNFALPDLRGRVGLGVGAGAGLPPATLGQQSGEESHNLSQNELPTHFHNVVAGNNGATGGTNIPGPAARPGSAHATGSGTPAVPVYSTKAPTVLMAPVGPAGSASHENRMPFLSVSYCIAMVGIFPSRN